MQSRVDGSSKPKASRSSYLLGKDEELLGALRRYLCSAGWEAEQIADRRAAILRLKKRPPSVWFIEGDLDDFETIHSLVSLRSSRMPSRIVLLIGDNDADGGHLTKRALGIRNLLVRPCGFAEIAAALEETCRSPSGAVLVEAVETTSRTTVGGGR